MNRRYVIYKEGLGVYLGHALGLGFWSKLDPVGQDMAVTFETVEATHEHITSWPHQPEGCVIKPINIAEDTYATIEECMAVGIPKWDPESGETDD